MHAKPLAAATLVVAVVVVALTQTANAAGDHPAIPSDPDPTAVSVVTIRATDFGYEVPAEIPAGAVTIRLVNAGQEMHHAQLIRLSDGKTLEDLGAALESGEVPDFATFVGGPGVVVPGGEASATVELRPGTYYVTCFVESPTDHTAHLAKGMVAKLEVAPGPRTPLPAADNTLMLTDYDFKFGKPLAAGHTVIRVRNYAPQPHEVMIVKLAPDRTMDDLMAWMEAGENGPPPAMPIGGMQALSEGVAGNLELDLEPGEYGLICFVPDVTDGQPHVAHGMVRQVTVE